MFLERDAFPRECNVRLDDPHSVNGHATGPIRRGRYASYRTLTETVLTLLLLLPAALVILLAAFLVKLTSCGPILYLQRRVGRNGQIYTIYKIRTMFHDCE